MQRRLSRGDSAKIRAERAKRINAQKNLHLAQAPPNFGMATQRHHFSLRLCSTSQHLTSSKHERHILSIPTTIKTNVWRRSSIALRTGGSGSANRHEHIS